MERVDSRLRQRRMEEGLPVDRSCLYPPPPGSVAAARHLQLVCEALTIGTMDAASAALDSIDMDALRAWSTLSSAVGSEWTTAKRLDREFAGERVRPAGRRPDLTVAESTAVYTRDGYHCRFCSIAVLDKHVRKLLTTLFGDRFRWQQWGAGADLGKHPAGLTLLAVVDHVVPWSHGGGNDISNLVTACQVCNYSRGDATLGASGLADPFDRPPALPGWDGGRSVLALAR